MSLWLFVCWQSERESKPKARLEVRETGRINTRVIMECKMWACKIFTLISTMQLDVRMSQILENYRTHFEGIQARFKGNEDAVRSLMLKEEQEQALKKRMGISSSLKKGAKKGANTLKDAMMIGMDNGRSLFNLSRTDMYDIIDQVDWMKQHITESDMTAVLLDLTSYEYPPLVGAAMQLLLEFRQQVKSVHENGLTVQLLVKDYMIESSRIFELSTSQQILNPQHAVCAKIGFSRAWTHYHSWQCCSS